MNALIDQTSLIKVKAGNPVDDAAIVAVDRNKWFFVCLVLLLMMSGMFIYIINLQGKVTANTKVAWVKLYSDGRSEVEFTSPENEQQFYRINIDKTLSDYVNYRWDERPATIREDYGRAFAFMGKQLQGYFTAPTGYNAAAHAAKITAQIGGDTTTYHVDSIDHYDTKAASSPDRKSKKKEILNRTNLYLTRTITGSMGEIKEKPKKYILHLDWRFATQSELQKQQKDYFMVDPLGIVIEEEQLDLSPVSDNQPESTQH